MSISHAIKPRMKQMCEPSKACCGLFSAIFPWRKNQTCCNTGSIAMSGPSAVWACSKIGSREPELSPLSRARRPFLVHYSNNMPSRWIVVVRWSAKRWLGKWRSPKMTRRPPDCVSAWGWKRGQQHDMGTLCKKTIDRKGAFPHHAVTHALDNANRYATRSKSESKMWREPLGSKIRRIPPHFASSHKMCTLPGKSSSEETIWFKRELDTLW